MITVSIIIPVYNTSAFIEQCLSSIFCQTFQDFEIIIVNDGSSDNSLELCEKYQFVHDNVRLINQLNQGVSSARNIGISVAKGTWVTFIDSDDWIHSDYLASLVKFTTDDYDIVMSGLNYFEDKTNRQLGHERITENTSFKLNAPEDCFAAIQLPLITSPVSKLYRRSVLINSHLQFDPTLSYAEDRDFNLRFLRHCRKIVTTSYIGYQYRKAVNGSLSSKQDYINFLKIDLAYWSKLKSFLDDKHCISESTLAYLAKRLFNFYNDRFTQVFSCPKYNNRIKLSILRSYIKEEQFIWLTRHLCSSNSSLLTNLIYQSRNRYILYIYLKLVSKWQPSV